MAVQKPISAGITAVGLLCLVGAFVLHRPLSVSLARMQGHAIIVDSSSKFVDHLPIGEEVIVSFSLRNLSDEAIEVAGGITTCGCAEILNVPFSIPTNQSRELNVRLFATQRYAETLENDGEFSVSATIYLGGQDPILVAIGGRVH